MLNIIKEKLDLSPDLKKNIVGQLLKFDNEYNELFLPLFADKEKVADKSDIEREIINLTKQKRKNQKSLYVRGC